MMANLTQILVLLAVAVTVVVTFQRLRIPSSLGYLLVGLILGPFTIGPVVDVPQMKALAEFGIVFLLFTIGLNFSLPWVGHWQKPSWHLRWSSSPVDGCCALFHLIAKHRSAEVFTLTVLLVALLAAWTTHSLGLSMAFGSFLAGMMLGDTEFRHQVESTIRPFRDVLLGLFFVGIGMLFDPRSIPQVWHWALLGAAVLLISKTLLVALMVRKTGVDRMTAWRTGVLLAVGGEFGLALIAIALSANVIDVYLGQNALTSVLFSMIAGPFLIRYNEAVANLFTGQAHRNIERDTQPLNPETTAHLHDHAARPAPCDQQMDRHYF